jgi:nucleoside-diphosphate-sugar epimerase
MALAREAIEAGVKGFVFASSAAVYGGANNRICRESDPCNPLTAYAWGKLVAEEGLRQLRSDHPGMAICIFRQGTVFGPSDNMRFDLAINTMVRAGVTRGTLHVYGPERYRPWLFIEDLPRLYARALSQAWDGLWNAAGSNATLGEVGRLVGDVVGCKVVEQGQTEDLRNYGANAGRLQEHLGDWHLRSLREAEKGVQAIVEWIKARSEEEVYSPRWERVEWLRQQRSSAPAAS